MALSLSLLVAKNTSTTLSPRAKLKFACALAGPLVLMGLEYPETRRVSRRLARFLVIVLTLLAVRRGTQQRPLRRSSVREDDRTTTFQPDSCRSFEVSDIQDRVGSTDAHCARVASISSTSVRAEVRVFWSRLINKARIKFPARPTHKQYGGKSQTTPPPTPPPTLSVEVLTAGRRNDQVIRSFELDDVKPEDWQTYEIEESGLTPDTDYVLQVYGRFGERSWQRILECRYGFATPGDSANLVANPGFEQAAETSKYVATRFVKYPGTARMWTPFYTGGYQLGCGAVIVNRTGQPAEEIHPHSGNCSMLLGKERPRSIWAEKVENFYGAHQAVPVPPPLESHPPGFVVRWWYRPIDVEGEPAETFSLQFSWQLADGSVFEEAVVPLFTDNSWQQGCARLQQSGMSGIRMIHVFFHLHQRLGAALLDDVEVLPADEVESYPDCVSLDGLRLKSDEEPTRNDLHANVRPERTQLTIAVALTADRASRLEQVSKAYAGGPLAASVLVKDEEDEILFTAMWQSRRWLRDYVDVQFVRDTESMKLGLLPINRMRNVAVRLSRTDFVLLLDVDLMPASDAFACMRDPESSFLENLLPRGQKLALIVPVFIADVNHRAPSSKPELQNALRHRTALPYCLNSQMGAHFGRWYSANEPYETLFETDYEPYAIVRREVYPEYDERFVGYGFNKVSWVVGAQASGFRLVLLPDHFLVHLNHLDNDWVQKISQLHYLKTWRRYFAFSAELAADGFVSKYVPRLIFNEQCVESGSCQSYDN